jgi:ABC-type Zn uptake system ZnuABC Zn-binding protein ZnuA
MPRRFWFLAGLFVLFAGLIVGFGGCSKPPDPWPDKPGLRIMTSFPPLYCFASNVAGDDATVLCLMTTTGPHDYPYPVGDAFKLHRADLFLINGLGLDDNLDKLKNNTGNPKLRFAVVGNCLPEPPSEASASGQRIKTGEVRHGNHTHPGGFDPHAWLGIPEAILMVQCIRDELKKADPQHAASYDQRAEAYIKKLQHLQTEGDEKLAAKTNRKLLSFHESLQYFARAFNLQVVDSIEAQAGVEPSPAQLQRLTKLARDNDVRVIAVEPQYPENTSAKTLLRELKQHGVDAQFVVVDPIETAQPEDLTPDFYERKMRANIDNLAKALP